MTGKQEDKSTETRDVLSTAQEDYIETIFNLASGMELSLIHI